MIRPLTEELQKKAIEELNEDPEILEEDIRNVQEWIKQQPHLIAPIDKQWILTFLRGCKYSHQAAKTKFDMFYTVKSLMPEITRPRNIFSAEIQTLLKSGLILPLPYTKEYNGPRVLLFQFGNCDPATLNPVSMAALTYMILHILMMEDDNLIVSGDIFWIDMTGFPLSLILQLTPSFLKNFFHCVQNALPVRMKGFLVTGSPMLGEKLVGLFRGYLAPKLRKRLFVYSERNFENIFKIIPESHMPKEFGGENSSIKEISEHWKNKVENYSTWFKKNDQYLTIETLRPGKPVSFDDVIGINGSFRKLSVD